MTSQTSHIILHLEGLKPTKQSLYYCGGGVVVVVHHCSPLLEDKDDDLTAVTRHVSSVLSLLMVP